MATFLLWTRVIRLITNCPSGVTMFNAYIVIKGWILLLNSLKKTSNGKNYAASIDAAIVSLEKLNNFH